MNQKKQSKSFLREALVQYFEQGIKSGSSLIGVEIEEFILHADSYEAAFYDGPGGVREVVQKLMALFPGASPYVGEDLLGFSTNQFTVTLEPAAQMEISIFPARSVRELSQIRNEYSDRLKSVLIPMGLIARSCGCQPESRVDEIPLISKERYRLMDRHFQMTGDGGREMMRGTCSTQVSLDYISEEDFRCKIQAAHYWIPALMLLTDHGNRFQGEDLKGFLKRYDIWGRTDPARCGILPGIFSPSYGFRDYAEYLERMPLIFQETDHGEEYTGFQTVAELYQDKKPDEKEIRHILSMAFPHIRVKQYLEIRVADSMPSRYVMAYCALLKGLLYSPEALKLVQERILSDGITEDRLHETMEDLMQRGWKGTIYGRPAEEFVRETLELAGRHLDEEEKNYLDAFQEVIDCGGIMKTIQEIRREYIELINADLEKNREGALALKDNMERSPLYYHDRFTSKTLQIPRLYSKEMAEQFRRIVDTTYGIFQKVIREYLAHADYRALFPFSKELEELILLPRGYEELLPIARFDIFYHEDTGRFYFCEINTDGTSGMNEDRLQDEFILDNPAHQEMRRRYKFKTFELFDSWVDSFMSLYRTYENQVDRPSIAIIDFLDTGTLREFQEFARHFQKAGYDCEICDIRDLRFENGALLSPSGHAIDAIYRRAVTTDIMEHKEEVGPFLEAMRKGACFIAGSFCTQIVHHKYLFHILHLPRTMQFLTEEEQAFIREHVPRTYPFSREYISREEVIAQRERYILKPEDSYGSQGVHAGVEYSQEEWEQIVDNVYGNGYICQEYVPQFASENIDFAFGDGKWHNYITMAGLFVYNGRFAGVFSRAAEGNGIIASKRNERTQVTYIVDC